MDAEDIPQSVVAAAVMARAAHASTPGILVAALAEYERLGYRLVREEATMDPRVELATAALISGAPVRLTTTSRDVTGRIFDIARSLYSPHITVGIRTKDGRVHYARVTKNDAALTAAQGGEDGS